MKTTKERVIEALNEIRPFLQKDGGDIDLIEVREEKVIVKLLGACSECSINHSTLKSGVEMTIKKYAPEIQEVINLQE